MRWTAIVRQCTAAPTAAFEASDIVLVNVALGELVEWLMLGPP